MQAQFSHDVDEFAVDSAVGWYRTGAEQGLAGGEHNLAVCYKNGFGVSRNFETAVTWYRLAAEQGYTPAQNSLGNRYRLGGGARGM